MVEPHEGALVQRVEAVPDGLRTLSEIELVFFCARNRGSLRVEVRLTLPGAFFRPLFVQSCQYRDVGVDKIGLRARDFSAALEKRASGRLVLQEAGQLVSG